jgi:hypothetical protein
MQQDNPIVRNIPHKRSIASATFDDQEYDGIVPVNQDPVEFKKSLSQSVSILLALLNTVEYHLLTR